MKNIMAMQARGHSKTRAPPPTVPERRSNAPTPSSPIIRYECLLWFIAINSGHISRGPNDTKTRIGTFVSPQG
ncbi:MAG: hypothetical protein M3O32_01145 [Actinomycetota bacterium]|nr:hypothetical protein [Actinomycetota bacterium]